MPHRRCIELNVQVLYVNRISKLNAGQERGKDSQLQRQAVRNLGGSNHRPESTLWMQADLGAVHGGMFNDTWILAFEYA